MAQNNRAAWLTEAKAPFVIREAPNYEPGDNEVIIKTSAVAINPADTLIHSSGMLVAKWPTILGVDVAGTIVSVGSGEVATRFKVGDRVLGLSSTFNKNFDEKYNTFQEYVPLWLPNIARIPDNVKDSDAAVLPLGLNTAAACLYEKAALALPLPPSKAGAGKTIIVWGGSSSVGANAIQLARASGYEVVATAGKANHALCKEIGASAVFEHKDPDVVDQVVATLQGKEVAGTVDAIGTDRTTEALCTILSKLGSHARQELASVRPGAESMAIHDIKISTVMANTVAEGEIGRQIWLNFLSKALEEGSYKCKPEALIVGNGLESIQGALDLMQGGSLWGGMADMTKRQGHLQGQAPPQEMLDRKTDVQKEQQLSGRKIVVTI